MTADLGRNPVLASSFSPTTTGMSTQPGRPFPIAGVTDSGVVGLHNYYGPQINTVAGWDPDGSLASRGYRLTRVQAFVKVDYCYNIVTCQNTLSVPITFVLGEFVNPYPPYTHTPPQRIGLKIFTGVDNPSADPLSQNGTGLFAEAYAYLGDATVTLAASDGGPIDFQPPDGYMHTFTGSTPGYILACNTTDPTILALFNSVSATLYVQQWYDLVAYFPGGGAQYFNNNQLLPGGQASFFFRYFYA